MLCPTCHQPLDTDGVHLCVADARQRWRCLDCATVSTGFAFAYGRCGHCGGALEALDAIDAIVALHARRADAAAALAGVRRAFEIELGGRAFYQRAATDTGDPA